MIATQLTGHQKRHQLEKLLIFRDQIMQKFISTSFTSAWACHRDYPSRGDPWVVGHVG